MFPTLMNPGRRCDCGRVGRGRCGLCVVHCCLLLSVQVLMAEVEVQVSIHAQLVLDDLLYVAVETALQRLDVEIVQCAAVQGVHQLSHHRRRHPMGHRLRRQRWTTGRRSLDAPPHYVVLTVQRIRRWFRLWIRWRHTRWRHTLDFALKV